MPKPRKKELITAPYFKWLLGQRNGIFMADGRSNEKNLGRHSLGTRNRQEALELVKRLDAVKAVEFALADRSILETPQGEALPLAEGRQLYLAHVARPSVLRGAAPSTVKRYRAVLDKFIVFADSESLHTWQQAAKKRVLENYGAWLDANDYAYATEYLELTTLKTIINWLIEEKKLPPECQVVLPLDKPQRTTTYCYRADEVQAIIAHCFAAPGLTWLAEVIVALTTTGLRISELAGLRWSDLNLEAELIGLVDTTRQGTRSDRTAARTTKNHRDRELPIHADLLAVLGRLKRHADGRVFHGPLGGRLKPDTVRNVLIREVLTPLAGRFPTRAGEQGLADGRLHSFRHYFCSASANAGVPEQVLMAWLGHQDSKMVKRYYHLHQEEAQRQMAKINFVSRDAVNEKPAGNDPATGALCSPAERLRNNLAIREGSSNVPPWWTREDAVIISMLVLVVVEPDSGQRSREPAHLFVSVLEVAEAAGGLTWEF